jgi:serine/threonine-protein kinase
MDAPQRIGRYEVIRPLGQGGMGRVFLAKDSVLGRLVALKVLREDLGLPPESREALFARMRQEARAAATLGHPNIVTLHDMGEDERLGLYLVFEYLMGPTLRERLGEGPLELPLVASMARQLGDALTLAHEAGVIHRDVKPENVILSAYGAKLTDFGIARLPDSTLTTAGSVLGTPAYSAPEALAQAQFGPLSDQFSLACTLFEAVCARRAYTADDALAIASRIATEPPPPLPGGAADGRTLARINAVLSRAMTREPSRRYPSCRAFGEALALAIETRTLDTPRPSDTPPPRSIIPRATRRVHNVIAALALVVILALVVLGRPAGSGVSLRRVSEELATAAVPPHRVLPPAAASDATNARRRPRPAASVAPDGGALALPTLGEERDAAGESEGAAVGVDAGLTSGLLPMRPEKRDSAAD